MSDFWQIVEFSHLLMEKHIDKGAVVIDATAGNGYDSLFLADLVGQSGKVYSFDIQKHAIENTRNRLEKNNLLSRVELIEDGHQNIDKYIKEEIGGMVFNLGYLPGGDKGIRTEKNTTISAIKKGLKLLKIGGLIVVVIYTGHPGGKEELNGIFDFATNLPLSNYNVLNYNYINQVSSPQVLAIIRRR